MERTFYFADLIVPLPACKCLAVVNLFVMLTEQCCIVVLAVDNYITFRRVAIHINESMKVYYRRRICSLVIPILLTLVAAVLGHKDSHNQGFGRRDEKDFCMLQGKAHYPEWIIQRTWVETDLKNVSPWINPSFTFHVSNRPTL